MCPVGGGPFSPEGRGLFLGSLMSAVWDEVGVAWLELAGDCE